MIHILCSISEAIIYSNVWYHLCLIPTNDNNNSKFLAAAILVGFNKLYPICIPYTPIREMISLQRGVVENSVLWNIMICDWQRAHQCFDRPKCLCLSSNSPRRVKKDPSGTDWPWRSWQNGASNLQTVLSIRSSVTFKKHWIFTFMYF